MKFIEFNLFAVPSLILRFACVSFADCSISGRNLETEKRSGGAARVAQPADTAAGGAFGGKAATHIPAGGSVRQAGRIRRCEERK